MDADSAAWLSSLASEGHERSAALARLHELLLRAALHEAHRRGPAARIAGPELEDIAHQAADDAMVSLLGKIGTFRGESRFTTWAYKFVVLEVGSKVGRHYSRRPTVPFEAEDWDRLPARFGDDPSTQAQHRDLVSAVERAVHDALTEHQRLFFVAIVLNGVPLEAMADRYQRSPGSIYKTVFDARRKIRAHLTANGYLEPEAVGASRGGQREEGVRA